ncbi:MAG: hypothetical protein JXM73_19880 [Anaerolineae bacterium]|nr:hypothetical protein [Anaerolineae bacterium]
MQDTEPEPEQNKPVLLPSSSTIQADFDRLAEQSKEGWDHNSHYHRFLLRHVPQRSADVLEICSWRTCCRG